MYGLGSVLCLAPSLCFLSYVSTNFIDTYVTVPIDVRTKKKKKLIKSFLFQWHSKYLMDVQGHNKSSAHDPWQDTWETYTQKQT